MEETPTVFVIDDDKDVREGICDLVEGMDYKSMQYASAEDFLKAFNPRQWGCVVLDVRMPGMSGLELQNTMITKGIDIPVIIVTGHGDVPMAVKAVSQGAVDFIEKPFREQMLWESIRKALEQCSNQLRSKKSKRDVQARLALLTEREKQTLGLLVQGNSDKEIARMLEVTQRAVAFHRNHIMEKMQVSSTVRLVRLLMENGIKV